MNEMSNLVNKIERRLGFIMCKLPEAIDKTHWANDVIIPDTISEFSRNYPHAITIYVDRDTPRDRDGYYLISEEMVDGAKIIGFKDIDWRRFSEPTLSGCAYSPLGIYDEINHSISDYTFDDVALTQATVDLNSVFQTTIIPDFQYPNRLKFLMTGQREYKIPYDHCPVTLFVEHPSNLMTISPTMMSWFEDLATSDVASYLYQQLKYFDGLETVFVNVDLKLDDLRQWAEKRENIVEYLRENRVSAANRNQPLIWTI